MNRRWDAKTWTPNHMPRIRLINVRRRLVFSSSSDGETLGSEDTWSHGTPSSSSSSEWLDEDTVSSTSGWEESSSDDEWPELVNRKLLKRTRESPTRFRQYCMYVYTRFTYNSRTSIQCALLLLELLQPGRVSRLIQLVLDRRVCTGLEETEVRISPT